MKYNTNAAAGIFFLKRRHWRCALLRTWILLAALAVAVGCGGGASNAPQPTPPAPPPPPPSSGAVTEPTTVTVGPGATASGNDVVVPAPAASPPENATVLGTGSSASNTGATIPRGTSMTVLLFGPGLSGSMQVTISGPNDIVISNLRSIQSTTNVPGVAFTAAVSADAALGARTVILRGTNDDITTFAGGLEVQP